MKRREFLGTAAAIPAAAVLPTLPEKKNPPRKDSLLSVKDNDAGRGHASTLIYDFTTDLGDGYVRVNQAGFFWVSYEQAYHLSQLEILVDGEWVAFNNLASYTEERQASYKLYGEMFMKVETIYDKDGKYVRGRADWTQLPHTLKEQIGVYHESET
jgi:hypothetical protein